MPFVGQAGENFNREIAKHGIDRSEFYITNMAKCLSDDNARPSAETIDRCAPFLQMEMTIIAPKFIISLGAVPFGYLCPNAIYSKALGKMTYSEVVGKQVFAIYHPSPLNLNVESRKKAFSKQIEMLCKMIKYFKQKEQGNSK